jgi:hypothetical protein
MEKVRRSRELGVLRLGQPLKSFRDNISDFEIYQKGAQLPYLDSLGPLIKPKRVKELGDLQIQQETGSPAKPVFVPAIPRGHEGPPPTGPSTETDITD